MTIITKPITVEKFTYNGTNQSLIKNIEVIKGELNTIRFVSKDLNARLQIFQALQNTMIPSLRIFHGENYVSVTERSNEAILIQQAINILKEKDYIDVVFAAKILTKLSEPLGFGFITTPERNQAHPSERSALPTMARISSSHFTFMRPSSSINNQNNIGLSSLELKKIKAQLFAKIQKQQKLNVCKNISYDPRNKPNEIQKQIIEATIKFPLDNITDTFDKDPTSALKALAASLSNNISNEDMKLFKEKDILDSIKQIHSILSHPYPQNRCESYPYFQPPSDPDMVVYKDADGKPAFEKKGLLGLTGRNDKTSMLITRKVTVDFIVELITREISNQEMKLEKINDTKILLKF